MPLRRGTVRVILRAVLRLLRPFAGTDRTLMLLFVLGAGLRTLYAMGTPFDVRAYDAGGQIEYLRYVALTFSIPPAAGGFLFHHAPLYYFLGGGLWAGLDALRMGTGAAFANLQLLSLLFSLCTLGIGMKALRAAFKDASAAAMACGIFACFPGLTMMASRISDDTLYAALSVLSAFLLLRWWKSGDNRTWLALWICIGLACLTKVSGLAIGAAAVGCLLLRKKPSRRRKLTLGLTACAVFLAMTAWYGAFRLSEPKTERTFTFGNVMLNHKLGITNEPSDYLTFNPLGMLDQPFVNPWKDETRRANLWEYLFRSSLFGEFRFPALDVLAVIVLLAALCALPLIAWGIWASRTLRAAVPMALLTAVLLASVLAYRLLFPNASNQDFRFIPAIVLPVSFYAAAGWAALKNLLRDAAAALLVFGCILYVALLGGLSLGIS